MSFTAASLLAYLFGAALTLNGTRGMVDPSAYSKDFGLALNPSHVPSICGRELTLGVITLTLNYLENRQAVGTVMMCAAITGGMDAWTCWKNGNKDAARRHGLACPVVVAVGVARLMGW